MTPREKKGALIGGIAAIVIALVFFAKCQLDLHREELLWASCLGKTVTGCRVPKGYEPIGPCPRWFECRTEPASHTYMSSKEVGPTKGSYDYVVVGLDEQGRIIRIQLERFYPAL